MRIVCFSAIRSIPTYIQYCLCLFLICRWRLGAEEVAIFGAASETFSKYVILTHTHTHTHRRRVITLLLLSVYMYVYVYRKNINCSIDESVEMFRGVCVAAAERNVPVRAYVTPVLYIPT